MKRVLTAAALLALTSTLVPTQSAVAQDALGGALLGGAAGAILGGAATGRAGGAIVGGVIGATMGAAVAGSMEPRRRRGHYWYQNGCWLQRRDGSYVRVQPYHCD